MSQNIKGDGNIHYKMDKMIYSPIRKLFNLTSSVKKRLKRNSFEKRNKKNISSNILNNNKENINKQKKKNQSLIDIDDNNMKNYINNNLKSSIFNTYANNNYIQLQNNIININNNQYSYKQNVINNINSNNEKKEKILSPPNKISNIINNKIKKEKQKNKKDKNNNKNIYTSRGVFKYKINKNKTNNNTNINTNNNINKKKKEYKNNIIELEMPYSSRYLFSSKKSEHNPVPKRNSNKIINNKIKSNISKTINNSIEKRKNKIKDIEINYRNIHKNSDLNMNNINTNTIMEEIKHNSTINNYGNQIGLNIDKTLNNKQINTIFSTLLDNNIYSPKKCLNRIHSQENIYNNSNKIFMKKKNKSLKNLKGFTYKKKNSSYKIKQKENSDDLIYNIKPDIYPEIKINLRNKIKPLNKNNSVVYKNDTRNLIINDSDFIIPKNNLSFVYIKNKIKGNELSFNSNTNRIKNIKINNTFSNINENTYFDIDTKEYVLQDNIKEEEIISSFISYTELNYIIILLEKIKDIFDSFSYNNNHFILKYCFEFLNFMYNYNVDNYISNAIINIIDMENRKILNNYFLFAIVIIYDLILREKKIFNDLNILVKETIKLIYANIIIIINYSKEISQKNLFLEKIINNINTKYIQNKDLYIDDNEYLLINKNKNSPEDKINYNLNFIIRNIHSFINNIKNSKNYNYFLEIFKNINNIPFENIYDFYINNIYQINIINSTLSIASKIIQNKSNNIPKNKISSNKYILLISLDETLIHFKIDDKNKNNNKGVIQLRPFLNEFLTEIKPYYEIIVFSNGDKKYTELILNAIDKNKIFFDNKLYREHCTIINNDFVKDINIIGKDISKIIIVDNLIQNYRLQIANGINIKSFYGEINDKILLELGNILVKIAKLGKDIRKGIAYYRDDIINKISSNIYLNYYK